MTKMSRFPRDEMIISSNVETLAKGPSLANASALPASFVHARVKLVQRVKNRLYALNYSNVPQVLKPTVPLVLSRDLDEGVNNLKTAGA